MSQYVDLNAFANSEVLNNPAIANSQILELNTIANSEVLNNPAIANSQILELNTIADPEVLNNPAIANSQILELNTIADPATINAPTVDISVIVVNTEGYGTPSGENLGPFAMTQISSEGALGFLIMLSQASGAPTLDYAVINGRRIEEEQIESSQSTSGNLSIFLHSFPLEIGDEFFQFRVVNPYGRPWEYGFFQILNSSHFRADPEITYGLATTQPSSTAFALLQSGVMFLAWMSLGEADVNTMLSPWTQTDVAAETEGFNFSFQFGWRYVFGPGSAPNGPVTASIADSDFLLVEYPFYEIGTLVVPGVSYARNGSVVEVSGGPAEPKYDYSQEPADQLPLPPDPEEIEVPLPPWLPEPVGPYRRSE